MINWKNTHNFSLTEKLNEFIQNKQFRSGYDELANQEITRLDQLSGHGQLWFTILNTIEDEGNKCYSYLKDQIGNIDIDTCSIDKVIKLSQFVGNDKQALLPFSNYIPNELKEVMDLLSINRSVLVLKDFLASEYLSSLKNIAYGLTFRYNKLVGITAGYSSSTIKNPNYSVLNSGELLLLAGTYHIEESDELIIINENVIVLSLLDDTPISKDFYVTWSYQWNDAKYVEWMDSLIYSTLAKNLMIDEIILDYDQSGLSSCSFSNKTENIRDLIDRPEIEKLKESYGIHSTYSIKLQVDNISRGQTSLSEYQSNYQTLILQEISYESTSSNINAHSQKIGRFNDNNRRIVQDYVTFVEQNNTFIDKTKIPLYFDVIDGKVVPRTTPRFKCFPIDDSKPTTNLTQFEASELFRRSEPEPYTSIYFIEGKSVYIQSILNLNSEIANQVLINITKLIRNYCIKVSYQREFTKFLSQKYKYVGAETIVKIFLQEYLAEQLGNDDSRFFETEFDKELSEINYQSLIKEIFVERGIQNIMDTVRKSISIQEYWDSTEYMNIGDGGNSPYVDQKNDKKIGNDSIQNLLLKTFQQHNWKASIDIDYWAIYCTHKVTEQIINTVLTFDLNDSIFVLQDSGEFLETKIQDLVSMPILNITFKTQLTDKIEYTTNKIISLNEDEKLISFLDDLWSFGCLNYRQDSTNLYLANDWLNSEYQIERFLNYYRIDSIDNGIRVSMNSPAAVEILKPVQDTNRFSLVEYTSVKNIQTEHLESNIFVDFIGTEIDTEKYSNISFEKNALGEYTLSYTDLTSYNDILEQNNNIIDRLVQVPSFDIKTQKIVWTNAKRMSHYDYWKSSLLIQLKHLSCDDEFEYIKRIWEINSSPELWRSSVMVNDILSTQSIKISDSPIPLEDNYSLSRNVDVSFSAVFEFYSAISNISTWIKGEYIPSFDMISKEFVSSFNYFTMWSVELDQTKLNPWVGMWDNSILPILTVRTYKTNSIDGFATFNDVFEYLLKNGILIYKKNDLISNDVYKLCTQFWGDNQLEPKFNKGESPIYHDKNKIYPTIATTPFIYNLVFKLSSDFVLNWYFTGVETEEVQLKKLAQRIDQDGNVKNLWRNDNVTWSAYQSQYQENLNFDWKGQTTFMVGEDTLFLFPALKEYLELNHLDDDYSDKLNQFYQKWYSSHLFITPTDEHRILSQLESWKEAIKSTKNKIVYQYSVDRNENVYILLKHSNKLEEPGELWMRIKSHPLAFPAFLSTDVCSSIRHSQISSLGKANIPLKQMLNQLTTNKNEYDNTEVEQGTGNILDFGIAKSKSSDVLWIYGKIDKDDLSAINQTCTNGVLIFGNLSPNIIDSNISVLNYSVLDTNYFISNIRNSFDIFQNQFHYFNHIGVESYVNGNDRGLLHLYRETVTDDQHNVIGDAVKCYQFSFEENVVSSKSALFTIINLLEKHKNMLGEDVKIVKYLPEFNSKLFVGSKLRSFWRCSKNLNNLTIACETEIVLSEESIFVYTDRLNRKHYKDFEKNTVYNPLLEKYNKVADGKISANEYNHNGYISFNIQFNPQDSIPNQNLKFDSTGNVGTYNVNYFTGLLGGRSDATRVFAYSGIDGLIADRLEQTWTEKEDLSIDDITTRVGELTDLFPSFVPSDVYDGTRLSYPSVYTFFDDDKQCNIQYFGLASPVQTFSYVKIDMLEPYAGTLSKVAAKNDGLVKLLISSTDNDLLKLKVFGVIPLTGHKSKNGTDQKPGMIVNTDSIYSSDIASTNRIDEHYYTWNIGVPLNKPSPLYESNGLYSSKGTGTISKPEVGCTEYLIKRNEKCSNYCMNDLTANWFVFTNEETTVHSFYTLDLNNDIFKIFLTGYSNNILNIRYEKVEISDILDGKHPRVLLKYVEQDKSFIQNRECVWTVPCSDICKEQVCNTLSPEIKHDTLIDFNIQESTYSQLIERTTINQWIIKLTFDKFTKFNVNDKIVVKFIDFEYSKFMFEDKEFSIIGTVLANLRPDMEYQVLKVEVEINKANIFDTLLQTGQFDLDKFCFVKVEPFLEYDYFRPSNEITNNYVLFSGTVFDKDTNEPISNAVVDIFNTPIWQAHPIESIIHYYNGNGNHFNLTTVDGFYLLKSTQEKIKGLSEVIDVSYIAEVKSFSDLSKNVTLHKCVGVLPEFLTVSNLSTILSDNTIIDGPYPIIYSADIKQWSLEKGNIIELFSIDEFLNSRFRIVMPKVKEGFSFKQNSFYEGHLICSVKTDIAGKFRTSCVASGIFTYDCKAINYLNYQPTTVETSDVTEVHVINEDNSINLKLTKI